MLPIIGVVVGGIIDKKNPWRGMFLGGLFGELAVAALGTVVMGAVLIDALDDQEEANDLLQEGN